MDSSQSQPIPQYMNKGSRGPHVGLLQSAVSMYAPPWAIRFDHDYGNVLAGAVSDFQGKVGIEADGNNGPANRTAMQERLNFDFETACMSVPGTTIFVQPDGTEIEWTSPGVPQE